jgi:hypothetical protein
LDRGARVSSRFGPIKGGVLDENGGGGLRILTATAMRAQRTNGHRRKKRSAAGMTP